jgi:hypothetical protein
VNVSGSSLILNSSTRGTFKVLNFSCIQGSFANIEIEHERPCEDAKVTSTYDTTQLEVSVDFTASSSSGCRATGPQEVHYVAIGVVVAVVVIVIILVAVIFGVKRIRMKVLPYRDRETWSKKS